MERRTEEGRILRRAEVWIESQNYYRHDPQRISHSVEKNESNQIKSILIVHQYTKHKNWAGGGGGGGDLTHGLKKLHL